VTTLYPCLWFDGKAEEAAEFYTGLLPDSHIDKVWRSPADTPSGPAGMVLTVDFTVAGQRLQGLNGGPDFNFNGALRLAEGPIRPVVADRSGGAQSAGGRSGPRASAARHGGDAPDGQDRGGRAPSRSRRPLMVSMSEPLAA
jgi:hypothetical protein